MRDEIQQVEVVTELMRMKTYIFTDADSRINEQRVVILLAQVRDLVYDAEDVVESPLVFCDKVHVVYGEKVMIRSARKNG